MTNRHGKKSQRSFLYRSLASYLREVYGRTLRKVPFDPGFGCPNRDGSVGTEGCSFCNLDSFVPPHARGDLDPVNQILEARKGREGEPFIAYMQAGTGTYTSPRRFKEMVDAVCDLPGAVGLFVSTRPDCLEEGHLEVLHPWLGRRLVWLELGLQSVHDETLRRIGRGHGMSHFKRAGDLARERGVPVLAHVILGLPGEGPEEMMATADTLADLAVEGVKIHHLQIIQGTGMADLMKQGEVTPLSLEDYLPLVAGFLERLPPSTVIHRLIADAMGDLLIAPLWPPRAAVVEAIRRYMTEKGMWQGKEYLKKVSRV